MYIYKLIKQKHMEKLAFLKSVRFWKLIAAGVAQALVSVGVLDVSIGTPIIAVLVGSVAIRTTDRFAENVGKK